MLSLAFIVGANLLPLIGVFFWGWDAFVLLILYWLETLIIAFWTMVVALLGPAPLLKGGKGTMGFPGRLAMVAFFTLHAGIFMTVHFVFLWVLFAGSWRDLIDGPVSFVRILILGTDLWFPLAVLFLIRGYFALAPCVRRSFGIDDSGEPGETFQVGGLYLRIFVMQFTIIVGGWIAIMAGGTVGPLILLVLFKTLIEVWFDRGKPAVAGGSGANPATRPD